MKEYRFNPDKIYFTSDLHIGHSKIIEYSHRPFKSVDEMNETLIKNWNDTVPDDGIVFDLGDFAIGGSKIWNDALSQLKGKHYLILGNHDYKNFREGYLKYFELVTQQLYIQVEGKSIYLNHLPFLCFGGAYKEDHNVWNLHGHVHLEPQANGRDIKRVLQYSFPTQYDVGVDQNNYRPISYFEVKKIIEEQIKERENKC